MNDRSFRPARIEDAEPLGDIVFAAFDDIATQHGFTPDFPNAALASGAIASLIAHPRFHSDVCEIDGVITGSNFLDERAVVPGVGPITVSPTTQNSGVGRELMERAIARSDERGAPGIRLLQAAYHARSLALYADLGFRVRDVVVCMQGAPPATTLPGRVTRPATEADLDACAALCSRVHGYDRRLELHDALNSGARVVEYDGNITGYATGIGFMSHAAARTTDDLIALISSAESIDGPGILIPCSNPSLLAWCLSSGLRITQTMILMTRGLYSEPDGVYIPSVLH